MSKELIVNFDDIQISCDLCGDESQGTVESIKKYLTLGAQHSVCSSCMESLIESYSLAHSGESYFGNSAGNGRDNGYRKKKISHRLQKAVFERDAYRCLNCETHLDLSVDHIIPESKGGTLDMDNLQTLCRSCNCKKGVKTGKQI